MMIYHYTSIQTLALILKSQKIRFNRLDRVDDIEESCYGSGPTQVKLGMYTFVSCWTKSNKENLALWNMYTRYKGVRIGVDEMPFKTYRVNDNFVSLLPSPMSFGLSLNYIIKCEIGSCVYDAEMIRSICDKVLKDKYNIAIDYEKYMLGTDSFPLKCYHGANAEVIRQNEEKDTYFYLKNYKGLKVAPLGALFVWDGGEWKRYTDLTYKLEGIVRPLLNRKEKKS